MPCCCGVEPPVTCLPCGSALDAKWPLWLFLDFTGWDCTGGANPGKVSIPQQSLNAGGTFQTMYQRGPVSNGAYSLNVTVGIWCENQQWKATAYVNVLPMVMQNNSLHCSTAFNYGRSSPITVLGICGSVISLTGGVNPATGVNDSTWTITE